MDTLKSGWTLHSKYMIGIIGEKREEIEPATFVVVM